MHRVLGVYPPSAAASFARERLAYFLDRLASATTADDELGSWFFAMPDFSPSLNPSRIHAGLPVGGVLGWANEAVVPTALPANGCGMLVARLPSVVTAEELLRRVTSLMADSPSIGDQPLIWDAGRKNHFLNLYRGTYGDSYCILHCSLPEFKNQISAELTPTVIQGPRGAIECFVGKEADRYRALAGTIEELSITKRERICRRIFPAGEILSNQNHVRMIAPNAAAIGCYVGASSTANMPLTVAPGHEAYLTGTKSVIDTPVGNFFVQPHGTGNSMSRPGEVVYDERTRKMTVHGTVSGGLTTSAEDVFDTWPTMDTVGHYYSEWLDSATDHLTPVVETKVDPKH